MVFFTAFFSLRILSVILIAIAMILIVRTWRFGASGEVLFVRTLMTILCALILAANVSSLAVAGVETFSAQSLITTPIEEYDSVTGALSDVLAAAIVLLIYKRGG